LEIATVARPEFFGRIAQHHKDPRRREFSRCAPAGDPRRSAHGRARILTRSTAFITSSVGQRSDRDPDKDVGLQRLWVTNSLSIRNWWLQRDTRTLTSTFMRTSTSATVNVTLGVRAPKAPTTRTASDLALRITLDSSSRSLRDTRLILTLDNVVQGGTTCTTNPRVVCEGNELLVKVGAATHVELQMGQ